jgi:hypothetical protein
LLSYKYELSYNLGSLGVSSLDISIEAEALCLSAFILSFHLNCWDILSVPLASHDELHLVVDAVLLILVSSFKMSLEIAAMKAVDAYLLVKAEALRVAERLCTFDLAEPEWLVGIIKNEMEY